MEFELEGQTFLVHRNRKTRQQQQQQPLKLNKITIYVSAHQNPNYAQEAFKKSNKIIYNEKPVVKWIIKCILWTFGKHFTCELIEMHTASATPFRYIVYECILLHRLTWI